MAVAAVAAQEQAVTLVRVQLSSRRQRQKLGLRLLQTLQPQWAAPGGQRLPQQQHQLRHARHWLHCPCPCRYVMRRAPPSLLSCARTAHQRVEFGAQAAAGEHLQRQRQRCQAQR